MDSTNRATSHPTEDILEEYLFQRLPEALNSQIEEHLLICQHCQDELTETERFVSALKTAAKHSTPAVESILLAWRNTGIGPRIARRDSVPLLALAILALVVVWKRPPEPPGPTATVSLYSLRSAGSQSAAPAGTPLKLSIEAPDLVSVKQSRVEVVDATGRLVWKGAMTETNGKLVATMPMPLVKGMYWVRLYSADSESLREFGMSAN